MAEKRRAARVTERIREELTTALRRDIRDPRVGRVLITRVEVPDDLQIATVFIRLEPVAPGPGLAPLDPEGPEEQAARKSALAGLKAASGRLRGLMSKGLGLRYTPDLRFAYDSAQEAATRVEELLREIAHEKKGEGLPSHGGGGCSEGSTEPGDQGSPRGSTWRAAPLGGVTLRPGCSVVGDRAMMRCGTRRAESPPRLADHGEGLKRKEESP